MSTGKTLCASEGSQHGKNGIEPQSKQLIPSDNDSPGSLDLFSRIFALPVEIRNLIWREFFQESHHKAVRPPCWPVGLVICGTCGQSNYPIGRATWFCPIPATNQTITLEVERMLWQSLRRVVFCDLFCYTKQLEKPWLGPLRWTPEIRVPLYGYSERGARATLEGCLQHIETVMQNKDINSGEENNGWTSETGLRRKTWLGGIKKVGTGWEVTLKKGKFSDAHNAALAGSLLYLPSYRRAPCST